MTMVPSLFRCVRVSDRVKARRKALLSGQSRATDGPVRKRVTGVSPVSEWRRLLSSQLHSHHGRKAG